MCICSAHMRCSLIPYKINTIQFKGIVYPKMKCMSLFTHSHVIPNLCDILYYLNTKGDILKSVVNQIILVGIAFHCMDKNTETFLKISSFMFHRRK